MVKIASVARIQEGVRSLTSINIANFPNVSCARDQSPEQRTNAIVYLCKPLHLGYVYKASVSCTGMIIALTAVEKLYAESNTMPTVRFLREIVYALGRNI